MKTFTVEEVAQVSLKPCIPPATVLKFPLAQQSRRLGKTIKINPYVFRQFTSGLQWIVIDSNVYDISKFAQLHPGGVGVLTTKSIGACITPLPVLLDLSPSPAAGQDATQAFYGLHRQEVLFRPQYARLQIGRVQGQEPVIVASPTDLSSVPYAEPTWLSPGYYSPYYTQSHRNFQKEVRKFFMEVVYPDAVKCEENGKRISQDVVDKLWCEHRWLRRRDVLTSIPARRTSWPCDWAKVNILRAVP